MTPHLYKIAFNKIGDYQRFEFDDFSSKLRRGLMLSCSLLIVLCVIEPDKASNSYEINIGVLKGSISQPWVVYTMTIIAATYYLSYFFIHLKKLVIKNCEKNFSESLFFFHLAEAVANTKIRDFWKDANGTYQNRPTINFEMAGGGAESIYPVKSTQNNLELTDEKCSEIDSADNFSVFRNAQAHCSITFHYEPNKDDFLAYHQYKDRFLRYRVSDFFTAKLPVYYGVFSVFCGVIKLLFLLQVI